MERGRIIRKLCLSYPFFSHDNDDNIWFIALHLQGILPSFTPFHSSSSSPFLFLLLLPLSQFVIGALVLFCLAVIFAVLSIIGGHLAGFFLCAVEALFLVLNPLFITSISYLSVGTTQPYHYILNIKSYTNDSSPLYLYQSTNTKYRERVAILDGNAIDRRKDTG